MEEINMFKNKEIIAYLAGIIDGEGCIRITKTPSSNGNICYSSVLTFMMQDKKPAKLFSEFFRIKISKRIEKGKNYYGIIIGGNKLKVILETLIPFLLVKKQKALYVLELIINREKFPPKIIYLNNHFRGTQSVPLILQNQRDKLFQLCQTKWS